MNISDIKRARDAAEQFIIENGSHHASFDTIMLMCFIEQRSDTAAKKPDHHSKPATTTHGTATDSATTTTDIPTWFLDSLKPHAGRRVTASAVLKGANLPSGIGELRQAGAWLRSLYGEPKRSNGQILYDISMRHVVEDMEDDVESPYNKAIPMASRVLAFMALNTGKYSELQIALAMGVDPTLAAQREIHSALTLHKVEHNGSAWIIGGPR